MADSEAGFAEGAAMIARALNADFNSLLAFGGTVTFKDETCPVFKKSNNKQAGELTNAVRIASRAADIAIRCATSPYRPLPQDPSVIRGQILGQGSRWVELENVLTLAWNHGIPVLHVSDFPTSKKPDGMALSIDGRPAVVVCKKEKTNAKIAFIVAHELGHIALGHVCGASSIVDSKVSPESQDAQERDATAFAIGLLTGSPQTAYTSDSNLTGPKLALAARKAGARDKVDPAVIALNYVWSKQHWALGANALKLLAPYDDAPKETNRVALANLSLGEVADDLSGFLSNLLEDGTAA